MAALVAAALGTWIGLHALRSATAAIVWNVAEDLPTSRLGVVALAIWLVALLGAVPARRIAGADAAWRLGLLLAVVAASRQTVSGELPTAVLAIASWIAWVWWLPAFLREVARRDALAQVAPGVLLGLAAQVATQAALHGSDLHAATGPVGAVGGIALSAAFALALRGALAPPVVDASRGVGWGAIALGPFLFLQATLLVNLGRLQLLGDWDLALAALAAEAGVLLAIAALRVRAAPLVTLASTVLAALLLAGLAFGAPAHLSVAAQAALALPLAAALGARRAGGEVGTLGGIALLFALLFLFYSGDPATWLWATAALVVGAGALVVMPRRLEPAPLPRARGGAVALSIAGIVAALVPYLAPVAAPRSADELVLLDYNIHQGLDLFGVPGMAAIAEAIEREGPDVVGLQEVNRGWDIAGGVDNFAWLRWRFPRYTAVWGPMHADHFGNAILSRHPIRQWGWDRYPLGASGLPRGYLWARIDMPAGEVLVITTHLTAFDRADERTERAEQAELLALFWARRPRTVLMGDLNDDPDAPAVRALLAAGLRDVLAGHGLRDRPTFRFSGNPFIAPHVSKLDYILASPDLVATRAAVIETTASDHFPLVATLRLPQTR